MVENKIRLNNYICIQIIGQLNEQAVNKARSFHASRAGVIALSFLEQE